MVYFLDMGLVVKTMTCDHCNKSIDSHDTETLLVISSELGRRYEKILCGKCGQKIKEILKDDE